MTPDEALRALRMIRYGPRPPTFSMLARQTGYHRQALHQVVNRGWVSERMAKRLGQVLEFQPVHISSGQIAFKNGLGDGIDGRGGARPGAGRPKKRRRRPARTARGQASRETSKSVTDSST